MPRYECYRGDQLPSSDLSGAFFLTDAKDRHWVCFEYSRIAGLRMKAGWGHMLVIDCADREGLRQRLSEAK